MFSNMTSIEEWKEQDDANLDFYNQDLIKCGTTSNVIFFIPFICKSEPMYLDRI